MFIKIGLEFQCLEGSDQNSNDWKNKKIIPMVIEIGPEFTVWEDKIIIPMLIEIGPEFHCLEA